MLELVDLGSVMIIFLVMGISGVVSWGVTQVTKKALDAWLKYTPETDDFPWWWNSMIRLEAILVGGLMGFILMHSVVGAGLGLTAGVLNTTLVAVVKNKLNSFVLVEKEKQTLVEKPNENISIVEKTLIKTEEKDEE